MSEDLRGQVALVTGASRGIGRATAIALGTAGSDVAVACSKESSEADNVITTLRDAGVRTTLLVGNMRDPSTAAALVERTVRELGTVDIVVNNAGAARDALAVRMGDADWESVIALDLTAAFHVCRAALRVMLRKRYGRIINVSSVAGVTGNPGQANYSAAKAGLIGLTKSLAREVATRNITVNSVAPGFIDTAMTSSLPATARDAALGTIPMGRMGTPEEVAACIAFLASREASYVTGHVLHVDGGLAA